jgi:hypothetical protein
MLDNEQIQQAIRTTIAAEILKGIDTDARNALLQASITKTLTEYSFSTAISKIVCARAEEVAGDMVKSGAASAEITAAVRKGMDLFIARLPEAVCKALTEAFAGESGTYGRGPGLILKHLGK